MGERLKDHFGRDVPVHIARMILGVEPRFPAKAFVADAVVGYEPLEPLDRARAIAAALARAAAGLPRRGGHSGSLARPATRANRGPRDDALPLHASRLLRRRARSRRLRRVDGDSARADPALHLRVQHPAFHRRGARAKPSRCSRRGLPMKASTSAGSSRRALAPGSHGGHGSKRSWLIRGRSCRFWNRSRTTPRNTSGVRSPTT